MQLRLVHTTGFEYDGQALTSYNQARMTPQTAPGQIVVHTRLEVDPTPWSHNYRDWFGNEVTAFEVLDPHSSMRVTAVSTVHTDRAPSPGPHLDWEQVLSPEVSDQLTEYLGLPKIVVPADDLAALAKQMAADFATPGEAALALCQQVNATMEYVPGATDHTTSAADAWGIGGGVCQDMAHVTLGALRSIGVPARYVSGYLHPKVDAVVGETVEGESHAWIEWWDGGWRGYDPTNDLEPGERWVVVATGRDYLDVRPLNGIYSGAGTSHMFVQVEVTRLA